MDEEARAPPSGGQPSSGTIRTYAPAELRTIGRQCSQRLPPANAVQAMFLYEMQRESESEQLFHNQMFRLARNEGASSAQQRRIEGLEGKVVQLEKAMKERAVEEKLAANQITIRGLMDKVKDLAKMIEGLDEKLNELQDKVDQVAEQRRDSVAGAGAEEATKAAFAQIKEDMDILFHDRDGALAMIQDLQKRFAVLESGPSAASEGSITSTTNQAAATNQVNTTADHIGSNDEATSITEATPTNAATPSNPATPAIEATANHTHRPSFAPPHRGLPTPPHLTPNRGTPPQTQRLPMRTSTPSQQPQDLVVPRGSSLVGLRGSNHAPPPVPTPSNLRSFSPGEQWAS
ncbi:hypothetical protein PRZ48_003142 [Zasmidium cellare]|uniref:Uncharacterized protein n=1 Tax=Zasmidium cellare TaxID=395010 RepID=A0ABR0EU68_ZASCE|nr:hypothetical protein PRZ48_003142 [Zasmidium cellare]